MSVSISIHNILFLDIETVSVVNKYTDLSKPMQQLWNKKHAILYKDKEALPTESFAEKAGIYAEFGKIVCISCAFISNEKSGNTLRIKSFYGDNEKEILLQFAQLLNTKYNYPNAQSICGHNIKEFDVPYICRRMLINGISLPQIINIHGKKPWEVSFIDTLQLWKFGDYKAYTSLNLLATLFDIPTPKDDIDGSMVNTVYWQENDLERIKTYCQKDVVTVCRLYQKLYNLPVLKDEQIIIVS